VGAFAGVASLTLLASIVAFFSYNYIGEGLHRIETHGIPVMSRALVFARQSAEYSTIASRLPASSDGAALLATIAELETKSGEMTATLDAFKTDWISASALKELRGSAEARFESTRSAAEAIRKRLAATRERERLVDRAIEIHQEIVESLAPLVDDASFELSTGLESLSRMPPNAAAGGVKRSQADVSTLQSLTDIRKEAFTALGILFEVSLCPSASLLTPLRDRFIASRDRAARALASLVPKVPGFLETINALFVFGGGPNDLFQARGEELAAAGESSSLIAASQASAAKLAAEVQLSVKTAEERTTAAVAAANATIVKSQLLLATLAAASLIFAIVFAWWYVGRGLLARLARLNQAILSLAEGNLDTDIPHEGRDELTRIATAMEVFKKSAIEARRLEWDKEMGRIADLKQREASFRLLFESNPVPMWVYDRKTLEFIAVNDAAIAHYGYSREQFLKMTVLDIRPPESRAAIARFLRQADGNYQIEEIWPHCKSDGSQVETVVYSRALRYHDRDAALVATVDISERKRAEARVTYLAHHDALTGLPNRVLFRERLQDALNRDRRDGSSAAVLLLDLDGFKDVNDTLGHAIGDLLLMTVAQRLLGSVRAVDTVSRLGGDEFAIVQKVMDVPADAAALAVRIQEVVGAPIELDGHTLMIGTSIGIVAAPGDGADPDLLLKNADLALYRAKEEGRGTYRFFEPGMDQRVRARLSLERDLRHALLTGQFRLNYQASVNIERNEITGFEALLRWTHPERGNVPPLDFIPLAEETGLIIPIGEWVLRQACADASSWPCPLTVAVNLSTAQLKSRALVQSIFDSLSAANLAPERLELEVTESIALQDAAAFQMLGRLHNLGVRIALDDFGTGFSSLSTLRRFPFDKIKIDRSFVSELSNVNVEAGAMVRSIAQLGDALAMTTTAEGVETKEQWDTVRVAGCTEMQGFLFSKPIPATDIAELLLKHRQTVLGQKTEIKKTASAA
jgi:diguanylate cyclase (GGDEF)-like protein/PAS domain S-box-containing protein